VLPVSRSRVITAKALAAVVDCVIFVLVTWGMSAAATQQYKLTRLFFNFLALEMISMFVIELIFLAIGLLLGCAMKQYKRSGSTAVGIILVAYFISVFVSMQANLDFLKYFTPSSISTPPNSSTRASWTWVFCCSRQPLSWSAWLRLIGLTTGAIYTFRRRPFCSLFPRDGFLPISRVDSAALAFAAVFFHFHGLRFTTWKKHRLEPNAKPQGLGCETQCPTYRMGIVLIQAIQERNLLP